MPFKRMSFELKPQEKRHQNKCFWSKHPYNKRNKKTHVKTNVFAGNTKGGSFTVPLTSCLTGLDQSVLQIKTKIVSCHTVYSKPVKQEVNSKVILPLLVFPGICNNCGQNNCQDKCGQEKKTIEQLEAVWLEQISFEQMWLDQCSNQKQWDRKAFFSKCGKKGNLHFSKSQPFYKMESHKDKGWHSQIFSQQLCNCSQDRLP